MKNLLTMLMLILFIGVNAQQHESSPYNGQSPWTFGLKAGLNLASVDGDYLDLEYVKDSESFIGFHAGAWANYFLNDRMALQAELLGSLQGGNLQYELAYQGNDIRSEVEMRLPYLVIPVSFQYKPIPNAYLEIGPQANILIKEDFAYSAFVNDVEIDEDEAEALISNRLKDSRRFDVGLNIGAGYEVYDNWTIYTRYTYGLITVDSREDNQRDLKNRVFIFGVAYQINL